MNQVFIKWIASCSSKPKRRKMKGTSGTQPRIRTTIPYKHCPISGTRATDSKISTKTSLLYPREILFQKQSHRTLESIAQRSQHRDTRVDPLNVKPLVPKTPRSNYGMQGYQIFLRDREYQKLLTRIDEIHNRKPKKPSFQGKFQNPGPELRRAFERKVREDNETNAKHLKNVKQTLNVKGEWQKHAKFHDTAKERLGRVPRNSKRTIETHGSTHIFHFPFAAQKSIPLCFIYVYEKSAEAYHSIVDSCACLILS